jgi:hypothetical protein
MSEFGLSGHPRQHLPLSHPPPDTLSQLRLNHAECLSVMLFPEVRNLMKSQVQGVAVPESGLSGQQQRVDQNTVWLAVGG